mmetsp:Transcript_11905/g.23100  ORF Transcript_11905/g.23100 Transcript_11905/m.23100 type:complete len:214 (-) Transcript_11905:76-717(-)
MATPGQLQMYNKLEVGEMFGLDHRAMDTRVGKIHRIHVYPDEKVPNAATYVVWLEDHTLGNILRMELLRNEAVLFVGYKVPHPLNHMIELRIQTMPRTSPEAVLRHAIVNLKAEVKSMLDQFDEGVKAFKDTQAKKLAANPGTVIVERPSVLMEQSSDAPFSTSEERIVTDSPDMEAEERDQRFQAQLEEFERVAGGTSTSFSPSYSPSPASG